MLTRRAFLRSAAAAAASRAAAGDAPATGPADPRFAPFDALMTGFLADRKVPGAALAVAREGQLVYARGFGFADAGRTVPVGPDALFRIASVSKPVTAVAVLQLAEKGRLKLDDPILRHVPLQPHLAPGAGVDPRLKDVTVRHCLQHLGGWDRDKSGDPIGIPREIAAALKIDLPVPPEAVVRYALGRPLDFDPGTRHAYSNVGYLLLGPAVAAAGGRAYEEYVRKEVLGPVGVTRAVLGRALPEDRAKGEVGYFDLKGRTGPCVYPPKVGRQVPLPDGCYNVEGFEAHGGWVMSAPDLVRFAAAFHDPARCRLLSEAGIKAMWGWPKVGGEDVYYGCGWMVRPVGGAFTAWHAGLIPGCSSLLVRRHDGLAWAVLFNAAFDPDDKPLVEAIDPLVHRAAAEVTWG